MCRAFCILSLLVCLNLQAGQPFLLNFQQDLDWITAPEPEVADSLSKDCFRFATPHIINVSPQDAGNTLTFDDGLLVWSVGITSPNSKNINAILSNVDLKIGDAIYVFDPQESHIQYFNYKRNTKTGYLQTFPLQGDSLIIEYHSTEGHPPSFTVETINSGFRSITTKASAGAFGSSSGCEENASCYDEYSDISRAVCRLMINGNTYGSGALINNTAQDGTPYVITAAHIFGGTQEFKTCVARFLWDSPDCQNKAYNNDYKEISASTLVTYNELRDCALLLLDEIPTDDLMPFYAGWDNSDEYTDETSICIHHPYGDVKKLSIGLAPYASTYSGKTAAGNLMTVGNHWRVLIWSSGATEGGSSGSPIFDETKHIRGCLTGGEASCRSPMNDYFWKFSGSWEDSEQTAQKPLGEALDPENTGVSKLEGMDFSDEGFKDIYNVDEYNVFVSAKDLNVLAERFPNNTNYKYLYGMYVGVESISREVSNFTAYVYTDNDGKPGEVIASYDFDSSDFTSGAVSYLDFGEPLEVNGSFHLAIEKEDSTLRFYYSKTASKDYANFLVDGQWLNLTEMTGEDGSYCSIFFGAKMSTPPTTIKEITVEEDLLDGITIIREGDILSIYGREFIQINIYSLNGVRVYSKNDFTETDQLIEINLNSLPKGLNILKVQCREGKKTEKLLVY